jgi:hypothetical protein
MSGNIHGSLAYVALTSLSIEHVMFLQKVGHVPHPSLYLPLPRLVVITEFDACCIM